MSEEEKEETIFYYKNEPDLETIQKIVEGYFTIIYIFPFESNPNVCKLMYVNEEGQLKNLPVNVEASKMAGFDVYGKVLIIDS